jgi:WD40 repeat protein
MRSDFIGDCALFLGLPEAINASQFLTPRLNRDQCRAAIVGPARAMGGEVETSLVNQLLNNLRADADHLPVLQHVLMRMWRMAAAASPGVAPTLGPAELEATGGLEHALSAHADEAFGQLSQPQQRIAEVMFRSLCEMGADARATRRLVRMDDIASIAETAVAEVDPVVEVFRHPDRSFLMPPSGIPLESDTVLDISHESLIRQWKRLADWVDEEAASARTYRRLRQTARLWKNGEAALWRTPDLEIAEAWKEKQRPNSAWANRYGGELDVSTEFLKASVAARSRSQRIRRWGTIGAFAAVLAVAAFMTFATWHALIAREGEQGARKLAERQARIAEEQKHLAVAATEEEQKARVEAENQAARADRSSYNASFTGILDQWRQTVDRSQFESRLSSFSVPNREFAWYFCQSLANRDSISADVLAIEGNAINSVSYLPNSEQLLLGTEDGSVQIGDTEDRGTSQLIWKHPGNEPILAVGASPQGQICAFASDDGKIGIIDMRSRRLLKFLEHGGARIRTLEFSPDGAVLAAGGDDRIVSLWRVPSGKPLKPLAGHTNWVSSIAFSPDGKTIASASYDTKIRVWDLDAQTAPIVLPGHEAPVLSIAFAPDGKRLASAGDDHVIKLWNLPAMKCQETQDGHAASVNAVAFSPNGELLVSGDDEGELRMWKVNNYYILNEAVPPQRRHAGAINVIEFSPTAKTFVTGSSDSTIMVWDATFGLRLDSIQAECFIPAAKEIAFASDARTFASVSGTEESTVVELWQRQADGHFSMSAKQSEQLAGIVNASSICFHPQREMLAIGTRDGSICLWDSTRLLQATSSDSHTGSVVAVTFDRSGQWLASADEQGWIYLWRFEVTSPQRVLVWRKHTASVRSLAFAPEAAGQKTLASASEDGTVRIWNLDAMLAVGNESLERAIDKYEIVFSDHEDWVGAVAFSPDRPILVSASDDGSIRVRQWNSWPLTSNPQHTHVLTGHHGAVTSLAISQDGKTLASGGVDKMVRLWDPLEGHLRLSLPGHLTRVRSVAFLSPNATSQPSALASLSENGALKFWMAETIESRSRSRERK